MMGDNSKPTIDLLHLPTTESIVTTTYTSSLSMSTNSSALSQCRVPFLEPLKDKDYESLEKFDDKLKPGKEINNNTEYPFSSFNLDGCYPIPQKERNLQDVSTNGSDESILTNGVIPYSYDSSCVQSTNNNFCTNDQFYAAGMKQYPYDNSRSSGNNNNSFPTNGTYFTHPYDNYYPYSTTYPDKNSALSPYPVREYPPCERYSSNTPDVNEPPHNWKTSMAMHAYPNVNNSQFYASEAYDTRRCFNPPQHTPFYASSPKTSLMRARKDEKAHMSTYSARGKRNTFASMRTKRDLNCALHQSMNTKRNICSTLSPKPRKTNTTGSSLSFPPNDHSQTKEGVKTPYHQNLIKTPNDGGSQPNIPPNGLTKPSKEPDSRMHNSNCTTNTLFKNTHDSANTAHIIQNGENKSTNSSNGPWEQVDDVIEEILCLEEGLETGNKLKKCDSQTILPQSQGDGVPGAICDLLELNGFMEDKTSVSCPSDVPKVKTEPQSNSDPQVVAFMKDRQKKDNHNMIERRRRFNINDRIRDLSQLLPKMNEPYHEIVRDIRHNKGQILRASVDYIRRLKSDLEVSKAKEDKMRAVEQQNRRLVLRVQELETLMRLNGISVEETKIDSNLLLPSITQSDVMSPTSTTLSPTTSPFTPTPTTSPFTPLPNHTTTSPPLNAVTVAGNFTATTATTCSSGSDLTDFNLCDDASITSADPSTLLSDLGVVDPHDAKKVKCQSAHLPDLLLEDLLMNDFSDGNLGLNLMDDDSFAFTGDPMFSSPQVSSPNSSRHSFEDALTPDSMDIVS